MKTFFKWISILLAIGALIAAAGLAGLYAYFAADLPKISSLKDYQPPIVTTVYSQSNQKIAEFSEQRRIVIPLEEMAAALIDAFVAAEDARFYDHEGIDFHSIIRAFFKNLEAGRIVQGGSTITQQVIKSLLLTPERSYERKLKEAILAYRLEKYLSKKEILTIYLNEIYLGDGAYGVEAAARSYFGKHVSELNLAEAAMLAGLPKAPSHFNPHRHPERAESRQHYVLRQMHDLGWITPEQYAQALSRNVEIRRMADPTWKIGALGFLFTATMKGLPFTPPMC